MKRSYKVTDHALKSLRERLPHVGEWLAKSDMLLGDLLDRALAKGWPDAKEIHYKGRLAYVVPLGTSFPWPLHAAIVLDGGHRIVRVVLTDKQVREDMASGKWSGWFPDKEPLTAKLGDIARLR